MAMVTAREWLLSPIHDTSIEPNRFDDHYRVLKQERAGAEALEHECIRSLWYRGLPDA